MRLLIKIGGTLLESEEHSSRLTSEIATVAKDHQTVLVHGGGKRLSRYLTARGIASEFRQGFRVTPPEILEAVVQVFAGSVNHELVAALQRAGARAVGLSGSIRAWLPRHLWVQGLAPSDGLTTRIPNYWTC